jgi:hypothetical protein
MLRQFTIESHGGFELSLGLTVNSFLAGFRIAEVPSSWARSCFGRVPFTPLELVGRTTASGTSTHSGRRNRVQRRDGWQLEILFSEEECREITEAMFEDCTSSIELTTGSTKGRACWA